MWQDTVLSAIGVVLTMLLLPQVWSSLHGKHVNRFTSLTTGTALGVMAGVYFTLDLVFGGIALVANASTWLIIFILGGRHEN